MDKYDDMELCPEGHKAVLHWQYDGRNEDGDERRYVSCSEIFCWKGPVRDTADQAITAWNRRAAALRAGAGEDAG